MWIPIQFCASKNVKNVLAAMSLQSNSKRRKYLLLPVQVNNLSSQEWVFTDLCTWHKTACRSWFVSISSLLSQCNNLITDIIYLILIALQQILKVCCFWNLFSVWQSFQWSWFISNINIYFIIILWAWYKKSRRENENVKIYNNYLIVVTLQNMSEEFIINY